MFTGLVKATGKIISATAAGGGREICVDLSGLDTEPAIGASIALSGACQTVVAFAGGIGKFFAAPETLRRTTLGSKQAGDLLNLEPALRMGDALDGHIVSGHVDAAVMVLDIRQAGKSQIWRFSLPEEIAHLVAEKGSVAVDGVSLTVAAVAADSFTVSAIPHTLEHTAFAHTSPGAKVNLEADILARYIARKLEVRNGGGITEEFLRSAGF